MSGPGRTIGITSAAIANDDFGLGITTRSNSVELVFWCEDSNAAFAAAVAAGGEPVHEPVDSQNRRLHYGWVRDPGGHQVKIRPEEMTGTSEHWVSQF